MITILRVLLYSDFVKITFPFANKIKRIINFVNEIQDFFFGRLIFQVFNILPIIIFDLHLDFLF
jgi:hypothetical protein